MNPVVILAILTPAFARPPLENITYLRNISLSYDGHGITNLDSINQMDGMDQGMANSLKQAILDVLPSYMAGTQHNTGTLDDVQHELNDGHSSDAHSSDMTVSPIAQPPIAVVGVANPASQDHIDDQFWSRDDLVHFFVNIDTITTTPTAALDTVTTGVPSNS
ncbi:hypothetical protein Y032_0004g1859 [Ancylostoma ceylanicum]|uniref:Uncharacterized protein n=1 Tax=Ancylostoma ceylanicum TaxID=53326 RepID=A0A016VW03_9BILA|nr:hypothetical protein Y032_0004g1859 [Ancylostoma ceylanicum]